MTRSLSPGAMKLHI